MDLSRGDSRVLKLDSMVDELGMVNSTLQWSFLRRGCDLVLMQ